MCSHPTCLKLTAFAQELLPNYRPAISAYFDALSELGFRLLHLLAAALALEETWFDDKFRHAQSKMKMKIVSLSACCGENCCAGAVVCTNQHS